MAGLVSTLTAQEMAEVEEKLGLSGGLGGSNLPGLAPPSRRAGGKKTVITVAELQELRANDVFLDGMYVRVTKDGQTGLVEASKLAKWTVTGWLPSD